MEFKLYFRTIFFPRSNTIITTRKGKEHTEDSERLEIDIWKKDGRKGTGKKTPKLKHSLMEEISERMRNSLINKEILEIFYFSSEFLRNM